MGRRINPIALRLRRVFQWRTTQYTTGHYKSSIGTVTPESKENATHILNHIFQFALISKPNFKYSPNGIIVSIFAYQTSFHSKYYPIKSLNIPTIEAILGQVFAQSHKGGLQRIELNKAAIFKSVGRSSELSEEEKSTDLATTLPSKPVQFEVITLKHPYLDATIMAQYVAKRLHSNSLTKMFEQLKRVVYDTSVSRT